MAKGCALSTGYLPQRGFPRNSVDRITDRPDMTSAVDGGCKPLSTAEVMSGRFVCLFVWVDGKASTQTNKNLFNLLKAGLIKFI